MDNNFNIGSIVKGKVSGIEKYGIFINFENGYSGMIHISEISEKFVSDVNAYATIGEIIPCKILEIDENRKKIKLTIKDLDYHLRRVGYYDENFAPLKEMLPTWIEEKKEEMNKF